MEVFSFKAKVTSRAGIKFRNVYFVWADLRLLHPTRKKSMLLKCQNREPCCWTLATGFFVYRFNTLLQLPLGYFDKGENIVKKTTHYSTSFSLSLGWLLIVDLPFNPLLSQNSARLTMIIVAATHQSKAQSTAADHCCPLHSTPQYKDYPYKILYQPIVNLQIFN